MSGTSYENQCPNCGQQMNCYSDHKPYDQVGGECWECGFCYYTKQEQMPLKELNDKRKEFNIDFGYEKFNPLYLSPLKKLPKCDLDKI